MSTITHPVIRICSSCGVELPLEAHACPQCHALVHGTRLDQLAKDARALELKGSFPQARELWDYSLTLLPHDSRQAEWVREHIRTLDTAHAAATAEPEPPSSRPWVRKLGPLGPIALLLLKGKGLLLALFKLKFLLSFFSFIAIYIALFGWWYGIGISVSLLIHEMGHYIDVRRRGLPADMPVFLPGLGAYVRWTNLGVSRRQIAQISLAGPLAGWIAAAACYLIYVKTGEPLWAALARTGAFINIFNLIPVWTLDGGQATNALGIMERIALLALTLALWSYTGEGMLFLVALGICWRLYTKDKPQQSDWSTFTYFAALLIALAVVLHATPSALLQR